MLVKDSKLTDIAKQFRAMDAFKSFEEIKRMEKQLLQLKTTAPPQTFQLIEQELTILRTFVSDFENTRSQNFALRAENLKLRENNTSKDKKILSKSNSSIVNIPGDQKDRKEKRHKYKEQIKYLRNKVNELENSNRRSSEFSDSSKGLPSQKTTCSEELICKLSFGFVDNFSQCELMEPGDCYRSLEAEINDLKIKAELAEELERKLEQMENSNRSELPIIKDKDNSRSLKSLELQIVSLERDRLKLKLAEMSAMENELKNLKSKLSEFNVVKAELAFYIEKSEVLHQRLASANLQIAKIEDGNIIQKENEELKVKIAGMNGLIANQEEEIGRLIKHLDRLIINLDNQQTNSKIIVNNLREEIESKETRITNMNIQLESLQSQLREVIEQVTIENSIVLDQLKKAEESSALLKIEIGSKDAECKALKVELAKKIELNKDLTDDLSKKNTLIEKVINNNSPESLVSHENYEILEKMLKNAQLALRKAANKIYKQNLQLQS